MKNSTTSDFAPHNLYTRRRFLRSSQAAVVAVGALPVLGSAVEGLEAACPSEQPVALTDYYDKLGVTKIINAAGTYTELTSEIGRASCRERV